MAQRYRTEKRTTPGGYRYEVQVVDEAAEPENKRVTPENKRAAEKSTESKRPGAAARTK